MDATPGNMPDVAYIHLFHNAIITVGKAEVNIAMKNPTDNRASWRGILEIEADRIALRDTTGGPQPYRTCS